jgi:SAM-dependent methyltransferase
MENLAAPARGDRLLEPDGEPTAERDDLAVYDSEFFQEVEALSVSSATAAVPVILELLPSKRVLDVGSGEGAWAEQFAAHGCEVLAVDGEFVDRTRLRVPEESFVPHDLRDPLPNAVLEWGADLTVCLEVAEHLPASRGPSLIAELCRSSDRLLFSAATPGQGGHGHVNERPTEYWVGLLGDQGFSVNRCLQALLSDLPDVASWYSKNALIAVRTD